MAVLKRASPHTLKLLPSLTDFRRERVEPICTKSSTLHAKRLPKRVSPSVLTELLRRARLRSDNADPMCR